MIIKFSILLNSFYSKNFERTVKFRDDNFFGRLKRTQGHEESGNFPPFPRKSQEKRGSGCYI
jgi:hypothetical protein